MNTLRFTNRGALLAAAILALSINGAYALDLDKDSKVTVSIGNNLTVDLYAKWVREGQPAAKDYYYAPSRVRVSAGQHDEPQITILTYISDGSDGASGGTFNAMVTWALTEQEERLVEQQLKRKVSGARLRGAVPLETDDTGQSISVLVALGGDEEVAWSGQAPTQAGGRAAIAANLSPLGATLLDRGIEVGNLAGISVSMNYRIPFMVDMGECRVRIDWDRMKASYDSRVYTQQKEGWKFLWWGTTHNTVNDHSMMINWGRESGAITNDCVYSRANEEQIEFFEKAIESFVASKLAATRQAEQAALRDEQDAEDDEEESGSNPDPDADHYEYRYSRYLLDSFSGTETYEITRAFGVRERFGPVVGNVREWVTGHEDAEGVRIESVNITAGEFSQVPVAFALGANAIEMFGIDDDIRPQLNSVVVTMKKERGNGEDFSRTHTFTRRAVDNGEIDTIFEYARVGLSPEPLNYEYAVTWNYVGRRGEQGPFQRSQSGSHTLEPDAQSVLLQFAVDSAQVQDSRILGATAEVKHRFLGRERTSYLNLIASGEPMASAVLFVDQDTPNVAVRTVFTHQQHGQMATDWVARSVPNSGGVMIFGIVPNELVDEEPGFIRSAQDAVANAAERRLDEVLEEFGRL